MNRVYRTRSIIVLAMSLANLYGNGRRRSGDETYFATPNYASRKRANFISVGADFVFQGHTS